MPAISMPETHPCSLCNAIHPQRPAWTPYSSDQTPIPVMVCQNYQYASSPYTLPPAYQDVEPSTFEETETPPTYSAAILDELGERISRIREQLDVGHEDLTVQARKDPEPWTAYGTAFVRTRREERARLERLGREQPTPTRTSPKEALPPELWSIAELLHRARSRPTPRQQTRSTSYEQTSRLPREDPPPSPRPIKDLTAPPRPQIELPSSLQTRPLSRGQTRPWSRSRQKNHHHGRASDVEDSINLVCDGVSWLSSKVIKVSRLVKSEYQQRRQLISRVRVRE